jgi:hypothetical protein
VNLKLTLLINETAGLLKGKTDSLSEKYIKLICLLRAIIGTFEASELLRLQPVIENLLSKGSNLEFAE